VGLTLIAGGCADPLSVDSTQALRDQIVSANRRQVQAIEGATTTEPTRDPVEMYLEKDAERVKQLDDISGPRVYLAQELEVGQPLDAKPTQAVTLSLQQAVRKTVTHNLDVQLAQLAPAISQAQIVAAEAVFDAVFFTDFNYANIDEPRPASVVGGFTVGTNSTVQNTADLTTGIRKPLETGGRLEVSSGFDYSNNKTPGFAQSPDPAWTSNLMVGVSQPLLRNFGTYVNRSQIMLARNAHRSDVLDLHNTLLRAASQVEQAYWNLVLLRRQLAIQQRLLKMTIDTRDTIFARAEFDVNPVQKAQAQAFVEARRFDVIRTAAIVRNASDTLKRLINDPELPVSDETLVVPADDPVELPLTYNLLDAVTSALRHRPEVRQALLQIDDASIRQTVADNQRLPLLVLNAQVEYQGLDDDLRGSGDRMTDANFINYILGAQFEAPIGNRAAEADFQRARLQRQSTVLAYRNTAQGVVLEVKQALRDLVTAWRLISVNRSARRAAAENLRALLEREERGEALTPEFLLDLKLSTQQRLADAETREVQSIIDYNNAIARLHQATGTLLEHNQINMQWPTNMFADE
jgi:outer membrane protein TolC